MAIIEEMSDKEFIRQTVYDDPWKILLFKQKFLSDDLWMIAIDQEPDIFKYVKNPSSNLCYYALEANGRNLEYVPEDKINSKMVAIASRTNRKGAKPYIPKKFLDKNDQDFYVDFDKNTRSHNDVMIDKVRRKPNSIKEMNNPPEELVCEAIKADPNIYLYFREHTPAMKNVIEEYYPQLTSLFPGFDND